MPDIEAIRRTLSQYNQQHLLTFVDDLSPEQADQLLGQIEQLDLAMLDRLAESHVRNEPEVEIPRDIQPAEILPVEPADEAQAELYERARALGRERIATGKVAAFVVAGGQGTRLGYDGPKGCLGVSPIRRKSLFQLFAEQIRATGERFGRAVPWYIMTSPINDAPTRAFFETNGFFGLDPADVMFFTQGTLPAFDREGKILLASKDSLALSPDGHGGSLTALRRSGALDDMARRGVEDISYFQVDNPLVRCVDPLFIGLHAEARAQMSAKALPKRDPMEKVGNFCKVDGKLTVIEYSDMPDELAEQTRPDGRLRFGAGSIAIHVIDRAFVEQLTEGGQCRLPMHRAEKTVPHVNTEGQRIEPDRPNAIKLEQFVFDALPMAERTVVLKTARIEEFSPVKNASGPDSLDTCLHDQVRRAAGWLKQAGADIPLDADGHAACAIEISPLFALDAAELAARLDERETPEITPGQDLVME